MGVVVFKTTLTRSAKLKANTYVKFKISDLQLYKQKMVQMISKGDYSKLSEQDQPKIDGYRQMKFTPDRYKVIEWVLFGSAAEQFVSTTNHGDVILLKQPRNIDWNSISSFKLTVKDASKLLVIGKSKYYGIWGQKECSEFLNKKKHSKCILHTEKENDKTVQIIKASRPYLRGNTIDSQKIKSYNKIQKQIDSNHTHFGFKKFKDVDDPKFNTYIVNRKKIKGRALDLTHVKWREKDYITQHNNPMMFDEKKVLVEMDGDEEIDLSHYAQFIKKDKPEES